MQVPVYNMQGDTVGQAELRDEIFGVSPNKPVMHQALVRQLANARQGTHDTKTRGEVRGGSAKMWRQKGTGRARQGDRRAPHWRHGGTVFGPTPRSYEQKMPRKMRRLALRSALSVKVADRQLVVLDELSFAAPKTREMGQVIARFAGDGSALILLPNSDLNVERSASNLTGVKTLRAEYLNVRDLLGYDYLIVPQAALPVIESILG
jgi:large subunit ribosomal protein L4